MIVFLHPNIRVLVKVFIIAMQLSRESYVMLPGDTLMEIRLVQLW